MAPAPLTEPTAADVKACTLGYLLVQENWKWLVRVAKSDSLYGIGEMRMLGIRYVINSAALAQPDDAEMSAFVSDMYSQTKRFTSDAMMPEEALAIGQDLVGMRKWCSARGLTMRWFKKAQANSKH